MELEKRLNKKGEIYCLVITCAEKEALDILWDLWPKYKYTEDVLGEFTNWAECWRSYYDGVSLRVYSYGFFRCQDDQGLPESVLNTVNNWETEVAPELDKAITEMEESAKNVELPSKCDTKFWDDFVVDVYRQILMRELDD